MGLIGGAAPFRLAVDELACGTVSRQQIGAANRHVREVGEMMVGVHPRDRKQSPPLGDPAPDENAPVHAPHHYADADPRLHTTKTTKRAVATDPMPLAPQ
jgi:hypothetical protein